MLTGIKARPLCLPAGAIEYFAVIKGAIRIKNATKILVTYRYTIQNRNPGRSNLMKDDKYILNFLAITDVELKSQPFQIVSQMRAAVAKDDYMKLHHLGYQIQKENHASVK